MWAPKSWFLFGVGVVDVDVDDTDEDYKTDAVRKQVAAC